MILLLAIAIGTLFAGAVYLMLRRSVVKLILGLVLLSHGVNLLHNTKAVLCADTTTDALYPFVNKWLNRFRHSSVIIPGTNVKMQIAITDMPVSNHSGYRAFSALIIQIQISQPLPHILNQLIQQRYWHRYVILQGERYKYTVSIPYKLTQILNMLLGYLRAMPR